MNPELEFAMIKMRQHETGGVLTASSDIEEEEAEREDEGRDDDGGEMMADEEENAAEDEDDDEDEEDAPLVRPIPTSSHHQSLFQHQQNCLAAAQMAHLIAASNGSGQPQQQQAQQPTPSAIEKENIPICKFCSKQFANFSNLNHHIAAIHLNQSKWVCSQCGKICSSKSNLKVHLRVHLRVKPYHCRWCSYSCMHHSSIRDHLAKVHPDKVHTPLQPGYLFNSQAVPEPEVFNSKGFNANTFTSENQGERGGQQCKRGSGVDGLPDMSPDRQTRMIKKPKVGGFNLISWKLTGWLIIIV